MNSEKIKIGQLKRIKKLQEKGLYHIPNIKQFNCKYCGKNFEYDIDAFNNPQYLQYCYCSDNCFRESGEKIFLKKKKELINRGYVIQDDISKIELDLLFKEMYIKRYKEKNSKEKWRNSIIEAHGKDSWKNAGYKGVKTFRIDFIEKHNLADDVNKLSDEEIDEIFIKNYNKIINIGECNKLRRLSKYDNNIELYKKSYTDALDKKYINKAIKDGIDIDKLTDKELSEIIDIYKNEYSKYISEKNKANVINWKLTHIKNAKLVGDNVNLSEDDINKLYHEYLVNRIKELSNSTKNGYKRTKKGWYNFKNINCELFYRSSWELETYKVLDLLTEYIDEISMPEGIIYYDDNNNLHKYFADIKIKNIYGKIIYFEIKPFRKIDDKINQCKFNAAKESFDNFFILTENEIFNDKFKDIIYEYIK